jgi:polyisoprenoid-binding protein YceI
VKKISFLLGLMLASFLVFTNFSATASNPTINERFNVDDKKDVGTSGAYNFNKAHTTIGFRVKHLGLVEVPGYFRDFTGTINYDSKDVSKSTVEFSAKTTSVDTGVAPRDNHLRTDAFFDVEKFPDMTFKSTKVEKKGKQWMITGDFTLKGVTKSITFPFEVAGFLKDEKTGGMAMGATAETTINRRDFGVNYGTNLPNGTPMLSDEIKVVLQIEANMAAPAMTPKTD